MSPKKTQRYVVYPRVLSKVIATLIFFSLLSSEQTFENFWKQRKKLSDMS